MAYQHRGSYEWHVYDLVFRNADGTLPEVWWRAEDLRYANYDPWAEYDQPTGSHLVIKLIPVPVARHTPKGVVLRDGTFIRGKATRQYAVPTQELAVRDLMARKATQISYCQNRLAQAQDHYRAAADALIQLLRQDRKEK